MSDPAERATAGERDTSLHLRKAAANDRESVAWLVSRYTPLLLCQARHRLPPSLRRHCDPDDAVADVWMVVLATLPSLRPAHGSFSLGLLRFASTVMLRRVRDLLEKHVLGKHVSPSDSDSDVDIPADTRGVVSHVVAEEARGLVWENIQRLSPKDREIIVLRGIEGQTHRDVAVRLGLTPENVMVRYHRALKRLRKLLPGSIFDDLEE
jgi:RNA polymerase sigma-70 factor, ECF subfamily